MKNDTAKRADCAQNPPESLDGIVDVLRIFRESSPEKQELLIDKASKEWGYHPLALRRAMERIKAETPEQESGDPPPLSGISLEEFDTAKLSPRCIVEDYLYANLSLVCAAGGTGKTTMMVYEAVCIAIGRDLWGLQVRYPGATLFITAEDPRELFAARLREILNAMDLHPYERQKAISRMNVWDVSGDLVRLAELRDGNVVLTDLADRIVEAYRDNPPTVIVFDPAISFGPGERLINDGEQAIVTACRRIIRGLGCCVRIVHHTGKANERAGAIDQYASRGGTALPDGSRMVAVLSSVKDGRHGTPPEGFELEEGDSGFILARAKLTYSAPQPNIWIRRRGYVFEHFIETPQTRAHRIEEKTRQAESDARAVYDFLSTELAEGRKHSGRTLGDIAPSKLDISRERVRKALSELETARRVFEEDLPQAERKGRRKTYLKPTEPPGYCAKDDSAIEPIQEHQEDPSNCAEINCATYREKGYGAIESAAPLLYPSLLRGNNTAQYGAIGAIEQSDDEGVPV